MAVDFIGVFKHHHHQLSHLVRDIYDGIEQCVPRVTQFHEQLLTVPLLHTTIVLGRNTYGECVVLVIIKN
jgi:hypothetical protein